MRDVDTHSDDVAAAARHARHLRDLLADVQAELDYFAGATPAARRALRMVLPGPVMGAITSLGASLYHEAHLRAWVAARGTCTDAD